MRKKKEGRTEGRKWNSRKLGRKITKQENYAQD
jgi:hypothetical protein